MDPISNATVRPDCTRQKSESANKSSRLWCCFSCTSVDEQKSEPYTQKSTVNVPDAPEKKLSSQDHKRRTVYACGKRIVLDISPPTTWGTGFSGASSTGLNAGIMSTGFSGYQGNDSSGSGCGIGGGDDICSGGGDYCGGLGGIGGLDCEYF